MSDSESDQYDKIGVQKTNIEALVAKHKAKAGDKKKKKLDQVLSKKERKNSIESASKRKQSVDQEEAKEIVIDGVKDFEDEVKQIAVDTTFEDLGVCPEICEAVKKMGYKHPSKIQ